MQDHRWRTLARPSAMTEAHRWRSKIMEVEYMRVVETAGADVTSITIAAPLMSIGEAA
jgi:hypothetical protein